MTGRFGFNLIASSLRTKLDRIFTIWAETGREKKNFYCVGIPRPVSEPLFQFYVFGRETYVKKLDSLFEDGPEVTRGEYRPFLVDKYTGMFWIQMKTW